MLLFFYKHRKEDKEEKDPVLGLQHQIDASIDEVKKHIDERLAKFGKKYVDPENKEAQAAITKEVDANIILAKAKVDEQVGQLRRIRKTKKPPTE